MRLTFKDSSYLLAALTFLGWKCAFHLLKKHELNTISSDIMPINMLGI
jgi:hypothetical protein